MQCEERCNPTKTLREEKGNHRIFRDIPFFTFKRKHHFCVMLDLSVPHLPSVTNTVWRTKCFEHSVMNALWQMQCDECSVTKTVWLTKFYFILIENTSLSWIYIYRYIESKISVKIISWSHFPNPKSINNLIHSPTCPAKPRWWIPS